MWKTMDMNYGINQEEKWDEAVITADCQFD